MTEHTLATMMACLGAVGAWAKPEVWVTPTWMRLIRDKADLVGYADGHIHQANRFAAKVIEKSSLDEPFVIVVRV